jgi:hypothetical protein
MFNPTFYKSRSLRGSFRIGMLKNWWVGFAIASMSVMFGGIASTMLIHNGLPEAVGLTYGGLFGGLCFLGSALGAIVLPSLFEGLRAVRAGVITTAALSFVSVAFLAYYLVFVPSIIVLALSYFLWILW